MTRISKSLLMSEHTLVHDTRVELHSNVGADDLTQETAGVIAVGSGIVAVLNGRSVGVGHIDVRECMWKRAMGSLKKMTSQSASSESVLSFRC